MEITEELLEMGITEEQLERDYAKYLLGDCTSWLKARMKRKNAKPVIVRICDESFHNILTQHATISVDSPDELISWLFKESLSNLVIVSAEHYNRSIYINVRYGKETNISLPVMETILSWFNMQNEMVNGLTEETTNENKQETI